VERFLGLVQPEAAGYPIGVDHKPDFGSTTAVIAYVRRRVTPTVLWSAIGTLVTVLVVAITWIVNMQSDMRRFKETVPALEQDRKEAAAQRDRDRDMLNKIDKAVGEMGVKLDNIADEVDRQREEWDHVHGIAESPPHARRRSK
jgi:hypothetical protein